jgi:hypothetical protein
MLRIVVSRADDAEAAITDEGWLEIRDAVIARAGVLEYRLGDGRILKELRDPAVIHTDEALASYEGRPVLLAEHPRDNQGRVTLATEENTAQLPVIGSLRNVRASTATDNDGKSHQVTVADVLIWHPDGISAARQGVRGFSVGYRTKVQMTPGVFDGEAYDTRQAADLGNHVVLTATPRAGDITEFRMDSLAAIADTTAGSASSLTGGPTMATYSLRGTEGEVSDNLVTVLDAEMKKADDMAAEIEALKAERDELAARVAKLEEEHSEMMEEPEADMAHGKKKDEEEEEMMGDTADISAQVETMVQERLALIDQSRSILPQSYVFAGKLPAEIRADAVSAVIPDMDVTGLSEEEIKGAYLVALNAPSRPTKANKTLAEATRGDSKQKKLNARQKVMSWYNNPAKRGNNKEG